MNMRTKDEVLHYLKRQRPAVAVLATASPDGQPTSSPVYYAATDDGEVLGEHYFSTVPEARKFSEGTMGLVRITPKKFRVVTSDGDTGAEVTEVT